MNAIANELWEAMGRRVSKGELTREVKGWNRRLPLPLDITAVTIRKNTLRLEKKREMSSKTSTKLRPIREVPKKSKGLAFREKRAKIEMLAGCRCFSQPVGVNMAQRTNLSSCRGAEMAYMRTRNFLTSVTLTLAGGATASEDDVLDTANFKLVKLRYSSWWRGEGRHGLLVPAIAKKFQGR